MFGGIRRPDGQVQTNRQRPSVFETFKTSRYNPHALLVSDTRTAACARRIVVFTGGAYGGNKHRGGTAILWISLNFSSPTYPQSEIILLVLVLRGQPDILAEARMSIIMAYRAPFTRYRECFYYQQLTFLHRHDTG